MKSGGVKGVIAVAKVTRPRLVNVYERSRLFNLLDKQREHSVIWIKGPPGAGKTTFIASYIDKRKLSSLWYSVDERDGDPATFFHYMGQAVKKANPRKRKPMPSLTPEYLMGLPIFTRNYFEEMFGRIKHPSLVVFDNYQQAPVGSPLHDVMVDGIAETPDKCNVVIISRIDPPPAYARLRANNSMEVIDWDALRFTLDEAKGVVKRRGKKLSQSAIEELFEKSDGWAAGLTLLMEQTDIEGKEAKAFAGETPSAVFDYFAYELLKKMDKQTQIILLKSAYLPKITSDLLTRLTGEKNAIEPLAELSESGYFVMKRSSPELEYKYHQMFHEFLLSHAKKTFSGKELSRIKGKAAKLLEEIGLLENAIELLIDIKDWDNATRVILANAQNLLEQGRFQVLAKWLISFPEDIVNGNPWLLFWMGKSLQGLDHIKAGLSFERAYRLFKSGGDRAGLFMAWSGICENLFFGFDNWTSVDRWITEMEEILEKDPSYPSREIETLVACAMVNALFLVRPEKDPLRHWYGRMIELTLKSGDINSRMYAAFLLITYRMFFGDFEKAGAVIEELLATKVGQAVNPAILLNVFCSTASYSWTVGDSDTSIKQVEEGLKLGEETGIFMRTHTLLLIGLQAALSINNPEIIRKYYPQSPEALRGASRIDHANFYSLKAWKALLEEDYEAAVTHIEVGLARNADIGWTFGTSLYKTLLASALLGLGRLDEVKEELRYLESAVEISGSTPIRFMALITKVRLAIAEGNEAEMKGALQEMMALGKANGIKKCYGWNPPVMANLCVLALENDIEVDYVRTLIKKGDLIPKKAPVHLESWPWAVKINTLGDFKIFINDKQLNFIGRAQKKPLELLKALISFGGKEVNLHMLAEALWPDADGDEAYNTFRSVLHRARKLIGHDEALIVAEGKLSLDDRYCRVDVWAFESIVNDLNAAIHSGENVEKIDSMIGKALALYRGEFLGSANVHLWSISMRERLRSKFLRTISSLVDYFNRTGNEERNIDLLLRSLEVEPMTEFFYEKLMPIYLKLSMHGEARAFYNRYIETLIKPLQMKASPVIERLFKSLSD